ncbi:MAG: SAM-dependent chlorinase/fluorinase [Gemmatimonadetes bacterium]|nr:SAM-dependent chlorinase/fluorinase [Gemmatimonadota bacterium]
MTGPARLESPRRITLLTDFGTPDGYAAAVRGVIASHAPLAVIEDVSHDIAPGDVRAAAWALDRYWDRYPEGTVHLVVVDPGVGSARRGIAVRTNARFGVGPDNGVLTGMLREPSARVVHLDRPDHWLETVSPTFHGRDVFAPASARLAVGGALDDLGSSIHDPVLLSIAEPRRTARGIEGEVIHVDRFGNLVTNVSGSDVVAGAEVRINGRRVGPLRRTYADVACGETVALTGSSGLLEISVRDGSAARAIDAGTGASVEVVLP